MATSNVVPKLYRGVIEDVIKNVRESFLNEGVDEQVLQELKQIWESKLLQSRAVDGIPAEGQQATRQQYVYPHLPPDQRITARAMTTLPSSQVNIAPATSVRVPKAVTPQQAASGQTAIMYPSTHAHALGQMTAAASAATMAIPGNLTQMRQGTTSHAYPTVRTIQTTQQMGNLQQQMLKFNTPQPRVIGNTQQQVIRTIQQQPAALGNTQVIRGPATVGNTQVIRGPATVGNTQLIRGPATVGNTQLIRGPATVGNTQVIRGPATVGNTQVIRGPATVGNTQVIRGPATVGNTQVIRGPATVGNTQVIRSTQPSALRGTQPGIIQMTQLQPGDKQPSGIHVIQVDGGNDSDSDDDDDDDDDDDVQKDKSKEDGLDEGADFEDEDPLNSDDDVSEDDPADLFDTDNVVVCQFDKVYQTGSGSRGKASRAIHFPFDEIARSRNKWKFHLKDGIMNLRGRDYVFQKATGEAEW